MFEQLLPLESLVYSPTSRHDAAKLAEIFSDDFLEFGSSGKVFDKAGVIEALVNEPSIDGEFVITDFETRELGEGVVLATYRLDLRNWDGSLRRASLRASIYRQKEDGWEQVFHQGTNVP